MTRQPNNVSHQENYNIAKIYFKKLIINTLNSNNTTLKLSFLYNQFTHKTVSMLKLKVATDSSLALTKLTASHV